MNSQKNDQQTKNSKNSFIFYLFYVGFIVGLVSYTVITLNKKSESVYPLNKLHQWFFHHKKTSVNDNKDIDDNEPVYIEVYKVIQEDSQVTFDTYGTIVGFQEQTIIFEMGGKITYINENRQVKKGDIYMSLDTSQLECKKEGYTAQLNAKKNYLKRLQELHKSDLASITQVEEIKKDAATLEAQLKELEVQMSNMVLTAPCDGYFFVKNTAASIGAVVQPRQELGYFFSNKKQIKFYIPHVYLLGLEPEEKIQVIFFPDFDSNQTPIEGTLSFDLKYIRPISTNESEHNPQMCEAMADLVKNDSVSPIFYNQNGKIRLLFNKKNKYYLIPEIALVIRGPKYFVYVIQNNRAILTEVNNLGTNKNGYIRVNQPDIDDNTVIVLRGLNKVFHMAKVKIVDNIVQGKNTTNK